MGLGSGSNSAAGHPPVDAFTSLRAVSVSSWLGFYIFERRCWHSMTWHLVLFGLL